MHRLKHTGVLLAIVLLLVWGVFVARWYSMATEEAELVAKHVAAVKAIHGFDKWAGTVSIEGKVIKSLELREEAFAQYGKTRILTPAAERQSQLNFVIEEQEDKTGGSVVICLFDGPLEAQEYLMQVLAMATAAPRPNYQRGEKGSPIDIGDVCFFPVRSGPYKDGYREKGTSLIRTLHFTRNNAFVTIRLGYREEKERIDILALAKTIDKALVASLEPIPGAEPHTSSAESEKE